LDKIYDVDSKTVGSLVICLASCPFRSY